MPEIKKCFYFLLAYFIYAFSSGQGQLISAQNNLLPGFVDMHTHPRNDLAFGTELFYGSPCGDISVSLKNCNSYHGGYGMFDNPKGNIFRNQLVNQAEGGFCGHTEHPREGYPNFTYWPSFCSIFHQQMWVDWIERAHQGGLNIMVALATHSHCMADAAETSGPYDDKTVMDSSVEGIKNLVNQSSFMEVALSPEDVRRIVGAGKLAVILGVEMDNLGNFYNPVEKKNAVYNPNPSWVEVQTEIDRLWKLGVRYILPIHITNNIFGGAALYESSFNISNKYNNGVEFIPEEVNTRETGIGFQLEHPIVSNNIEASFLAKIIFGLVGGILPDVVNPSRPENYTYWSSKNGFGHRNSLGLTLMGKQALSYMMQKGFIIDVDHISEKGVTELMDFCLLHNYPLNSGHNELREEGGNENNRTELQYRQIIQTGGMIGLGHAGMAHAFVKRWRRTLGVVGLKNVAIGTDVNGFFPLPAVDTTLTIKYDATLKKCTTGNRIWDINVDGFAQYGLFPDYIRSWEAAGLTETEKNTFMLSAEYFTQMWERCEKNKNSIPLWVE
jgi:microsomal dipeptidase-like Zn-dependent dipeptidase